MAHLIKIGNVQGIKIPQPLIEQANLQNKEVEIQVVENGLLIKAIQNPRIGWEAQFEKISALHVEQDFNAANASLDHSAVLATGEAWEW